MRTFLGLPDFFYQRGWDFAGDFLGNLSDRFGTFMDEHGVLSPFLLLFLEESGIPIPLPGDVMVMFAGYQVSQDNLAYGQALLAAVLVVAGGSSILYGIARLWGTRLIARFGRYVHCPPERIEKVRPVFNRFGALAVIFGRHIPGFRVPITLLAGILRFPYPVFVASVMMSTAIWAGIFLIVGIQLGSRVEDLTHPHGRIWLVVIFTVVVVALAVLWWRRRQRHAHPLREQIAA